MQTLLLPIFCWQAALARAREGRTAVGFADLYEEARRENPGDRSLDPAPAKRSDPTSTKPVMPLAQRRSKWAVYVDGEAATKEEPKEEDPRVLEAENFKQEGNKLYVEFGRFNYTSLSLSLSLMLSLPHLNLFLY